MTIAPEIMDRVARATVRFPRRGGQGVLIRGGLVLTAAHVIEWTHEGCMVLGEDARFLQPIEAGGRKLMAYPLAVEPVADLAILGSPDGQWVPDEAEAFEQFCEATAAVSLTTEEFPIGEPVPAYVLSHTRRWLTGQVTQWRPDGAAQLTLEVDEGIEGGTSGSPVVTEHGLLLGVVSNAGGTRGEPYRKGSIPRPHLAAPVWLARQMIESSDRPRSAEEEENAIAARSPAPCLNTARAVAHQPRTDQGEKPMSVIRLPQPVRPAKPVLPQLAQQIDDLSSNSGEARSP